jgi:hypothetical protein
MDPAPFWAFERAQELMDADPHLSYEHALTIANKEIRQVDA